MRDIRKGLPLLLTFILCLSFAGAAWASTEPAEETAEEILTEDVLLEAEPAPVVDGETFLDYDYYLTYSVTDGEVTIVEYTLFGGDIVIPSTLNGYPVTGIGGSAFLSRGVTSVTIPDSVTSIGDWAFAKCPGLTSVIIPEGVTSIGKRAFFGCTGLTNIEVSIDNTQYASVDGVLFNKDKTELLCCPNGKTGAYTIPDSVTGIGFDAFSGCTGLTSIMIPDSVTSIDDWAFGYCSGLTSVIVPEGVTEIGYATFGDCTSLASVTIPYSVTFIKDSAFSECSGLTDVYYAGSESDWGKIRLLEQGNQYLTEATIHFNSGGTAPADVDPLDADGDTYVTVIDAQLHLGRGNNYSAAQALKRTVGIEEP